MLGAVACSDGPSNAGGVAHSCTNLPTLYATALENARTCDPGSAAPCRTLVRLDLLCGCQTYVDDPTAVNALFAEWQAKACATTPPFQTMTCVDGCREEVPRTCIAGNTVGSCQELQP